MIGSLRNDKHLFGPQYPPLRCKAGQTRGLALVPSWKERLSKALNALTECPNIDALCRIPPISNTDRPEAHPDLTTIVFREDGEIAIWSLSTELPRDEERFRKHEFYIFFSDQTYCQPCHVGALDFAATVKHTLRMIFTRDRVIVSRLLRESGVALPTGATGARPPKEARSVGYEFCRLAFPQCGNNHGHPSHLPIAGFRIE